VQFGWGHPGPEILVIAPDPMAGDNGGKNITLGHVLSSLPLIPDATVRDVMDIQGGYLCYDYQGWHWTGLDWTLGWGATYGHV